MSIEAGRMLWRCRRGLLELDIVLRVFVEQSYASLTEDEAEAFIRLLAYEDNDLWDLVSGRMTLEDAAQVRVLETLKKHRLCLG
ncbi:MAG TPA: succinate dehydrogenase assembly factor 2 [Methylophilaceae bacterium]|nr:succinate dehydrogenase assembly factor 2 [Methylophilaceae bacterium]